MRRSRLTQMGTVNPIYQYQEPTRMALMLISKADTFSFLAECGKSLLDTLPQLLHDRIFFGTHLVIIIPGHADFESRVLATKSDHLARCRLKGFRITVAVKRVMAAGGINDIGVGVVSDDGPICQGEHFEITAVWRKGKKLTGHPGFCACQFPGANGLVLQFTFTLNHGCMQDVIFNRIILLQFG